MIFLGETFFGGRRFAGLSSPTLDTLDKIQITDGKYSQLFLSSDTTITEDNFKNSEWTRDTKMYADYESGSFEAGNVGFNVRNTDHIVIKRRELGEYNWTTIYVKEINNPEDLKLSFIDKYAMANTTYEYSVSSYLNDVENSYVTCTVKSDFNGFYIADKESMYGTYCDLDSCDTTQNLINQNISLLNSKYNTVVSNSRQKGESGSVTASFIKFDTDGILLSESLQYRNNLKSRLATGKPMVLKMDDGRIWLISIVGTPTDSAKDDSDIRQISFNWVEIGDVNDPETLYINNLSDVEARWW